MRFNNLHAVILSMDDRIISMVGRGAAPLDIPPVSCFYYREHGVMETTSGNRRVYDVDVYCDMDVLYDRTLRREIDSQCEELLQWYDDQGW